MEKNTCPEYVDAVYLAHKLGVAIITIRKWDMSRRIPGRVKLSRRCVRYRLADVERHLAGGRLMLSKGI